MYVKTVINETQVVVMVDSGATHNFIYLLELQRLSLDITPLTQVVSRLLIQKPSQLRVCLMWRCKFVCGRGRVP